MIGDVVRVIDEIDEMINEMDALHMQNEGLYELINKFQDDNKIDLIGTSARACQRAYTWSQLEAIRHRLAVLAEQEAAQ